MPTWWVLSKSWYLSMWRTLEEMGTSFHVLKVSLAFLTAALNSSFVDWGTLPTSSWVAYKILLTMRVILTGLITSNERAPLDSTHWPFMKFLYYIIFKRSDIAHIGFATLISLGLVLQLTLLEKCLLVACESIDTSYLYKYNLINYNIHGL